MFRRVLAALVLWVAFAATGWTQSAPGWVAGQIITPKMLNNEFALKQDYSALLYDFTTLGAGAVPGQFLYFPAPAQVGVGTVGSGLSFMDGVLSATAQAEIAANTFLGNTGSGLATPLPEALPSCSLSVDALQYVTGSGFQCNPLGTAVTKNLGVSVNDPGSGTLEAILPVQTVTGANNTAATTCGWLFYKTRRSNSGSAMGDTLPASTCPALSNGSRIDLANSDASAADTLSAGSGTSVSSGCLTVPPGKDFMLVYDAPNTTWRGDGNSCSVSLTTNVLTFGTHLTGTSYNGSANITLATDATNANTASTIVARDASGNTIVQMLTLDGTTTNPTDAATKSYVDAAVSYPFTTHPFVTLTTAAALSANTYSNGTAGVGATLTGNSNGALTVDGVLTTTSIRVLVKNESASANNGCYTVTTVGTGSTPYVLTRCTDFNQTSNVTYNSYFFTSSGTANGNTGWIMTTSGSITLGTTGIAFTQFSASTVYGAGTGLALTGDVFSCNLATSSLLGCVEPDGTTLSNASGAISLNLANPNTWSATQNFTTFELAGNLFSTGGSLAIANLTTANDILAVTSSGHVGQTATPMLTSLTLGAGAALTSTGAGGALGTGAFVNTGTSGGTVPLLNGNNTVSGAWNFTSTVSYGGITGANRVAISALPTPFTVLANASTGTNSGNCTVSACRTLPYVVAEAIDNFDFVGSVLNIEATGAFTTGVSIPSATPGGGFFELSAQGGGASIILTSNCTNPYAIAVENGGYLITSGSWEIGSTCPTYGTDLLIEYGGYLAQNGAMKFDAATASWGELSNYANFYGSAGITINGSAGSSGFLLSTYASMTLAAGQNYTVAAGSWTVGGGTGAVFDLIDHGFLDTGNGGAFVNTGTITGYQYFLANASIIDREQQSSAMPGTLAGVVYGGSCYYAAGPTTTYCGGENFLAYTLSVATTSDLIGTVTGPDSSQWTSTGFGQLYSLGVGESSPGAGNISIAGELLVRGTPLTGIAGLGALGASSGDGVIVQGYGSAADVALANRNGTIAAYVPSNTQNWYVQGLEIVTGTVQGSSFNTSSGTGITCSGGINPVTVTVSGGIVTHC